MLKWISNGTIASVLAGSLWLAQAVRPDGAALPLQVAVAAVAVQAGASAPSH